MISHKELILYMAVFLMGGVIIYGTFFKEATETVIVTDFSEVYKRDSIIRVKDLQIESKDKAIAWRDSLLGNVLIMEQEGRDTILAALVDSYSESIGEEREDLTNEALNSLE